MNGMTQYFQNMRKWQHPQDSVHHFYVPYYDQIQRYSDPEYILILKINTFFSFFWSGHRGSKAYSLWGGIIPSPSIGYDYL